MGKADKATECSLNGLTVMVTRPVEQAASLLKAIGSQGGVVKNYPLLEIHAAQTAPSAFDQLDQFDLIIFVSRNAVSHAWAYLNSGLPARLKVAAMGQATAAALQAHKQHVDFVPTDSFDSEGLLALEGLQSLPAQKVLIVRGQAGREHLAQGLENRGAVVEYAEVYRRFRTEQALTNAYQDVAAIVVSSTEALQHLAECARRDQQAWVFDKMLVVIHPRIALQASELGFTLRPVIVGQDHDQGLDCAIVDALKSIKQKYAMEH